MNEQLTKLAQQANIEFTYDPTEVPVRAFVECWEDELEKFAEMIVRECIAVHLDDYGIDIIGDVLKKHFGVEE